MTEKRYCKQCGKELVRKKIKSKSDKRGWRWESNNNFLAHTFCSHFCSGLYTQKESPEAYFDRITKIIKMIEEGKSATEVGKIIGISQQRVLQILKKNGYCYGEILEKRRVEAFENKITRKCNYCGKDYKFGSLGTRTKYCSEDCLSNRNKEYHREKARQWYQKPENKEKIKYWEKINKEKVISYIKKYLNTDKGKEKRKKIWQKYYLTHREEIRSRARQRYAKNKQNQLLQEVK